MLLGSSTTLGLTTFLGTGSPPVVYRRLHVGGVTVIGELHAGPYRIR